MNSAICHMMAPAASRVLRACLAHAWRLTLEAPGLRHHHHVLGTGPRDPP